MRHHDTVFRQLAKWIDFRAFDKAVAQHGGDARVRTCRCRDQLMALLMAQLSGVRSLRDLEAMQAMERHRLYHLGARPLRRATLADANALRPAAIFAELFAALAGQAGRKLRRDLARLRIPSVSGNTASPKPCHAFGAPGLLASVFLVRMFPKRF